jgi:hypothetical protein
MGNRNLSALAAALVALGACEYQAERPVDDTPGIPSAAEEAGPGSLVEERPALRTDTIRIEGMAEPIELRLVASPATFPLPFSTYVPPDLAFEGARRGDQPELRFIAEFGGLRNESAFLEVAAYPANVTEDGAFERARRAAGIDATPVDSMEAAFDWAIRGWRATSRDGAGETLTRVMLGRQEDRHFHVRIRYPSEYADGFGPRAAMVLREWRWADGTPLDQGDGT